MMTGKGTEILHPALGSALEGEDPERTWDDSGQREAQDQTLISVIPQPLWAWRRLF